ncbi:hypothetical protein BDY21DRAFT_66538 [Lineolata rhizophorae]|uniref:Uncharacterized protein n=1 Tax=Lineolata rhizophorae TaxID=578093 RepID=A0A6A6NVH5_9PEZI|nr:hypothetical protein BDY21DRAFT_66538 [Lineolata rhizophorae]
MRAVFMCFLVSRASPKLRVAVVDEGIITPSLSAKTLYIVVCRSRIESHFTSLSPENPYSSARTIPHIQWDQRVARCCAALAFVEELG